MEVTEEEARLYTTRELAAEDGWVQQHRDVRALDMAGKGFAQRGSYSIQAKSVNPYNSSFDLLTRDLKRLKRNGYRVVLLSGSRTRARRLAEDLRDYNLSSFYSDDMEREVLPGETHDGLRPCGGQGMNIRC